MKINYKPEVCEHCTQTTTYVVPLDRGAAIICKALYAAIRRKGLNCIHPGKEMEVPRKEWTYVQAINEGILPSNFIDNFSRVRFHGLIARVDGQAGNWCLTTKGAAFLRGEPVQRFAIRSKKEHRTIGYFETGNPNHDRVVIHELGREGETWNVPGFEIVEGRIVEAPKPAGGLF